MAKKTDDITSNETLQGVVKKYRQKIASPTQHIQSLSERLEQADINLTIETEQLYSKDTSQEDRLEALRAIPHIRKRQSGLEVEEAAARADRFELLQSQLRTSVGRIIDPTITRSRIGGRTLDYDVKSKSIMSAYSSSESKLLRRQTSLGSALSKLTGQMEDINTGEGELSEEKIQKLEHLEGARSNLITKLAENRSTLSAMKKLGQTDDAVLMRAQKTLARTGKEIGGVSIEDKVRTGQTGSYQEEVANRASVYKDLEGAQKRILDTTNKTAAEYENLISVIKEHEEKLTTANETIGEMEKQGKTLGKKWEKAGQTGAYLQQFGQGAMDVSQGIRGVGIDAPLTQKRVQQGYAQLELDRYNETVSAASGDPAAMLRVLQNTRVGAQEFGQSLKGRDETARALEIGGTVLNATGQVMSNGVQGAAMSTMKGEHPAWGAFKGGAGAAVSGIAQVSTQAAMLSMGAAGLTDVQAQQAQIALETVKNEAVSRQIGTYQNQYSAIGEGLRGTGAGYEASAAGMIANRGKLKNLSTQQISGMLGDISTLGTKATANIEYGSGRDQAAFAMERGQELYKAGTLRSAEQYTSMLGQLGAAGGDTKALEAAIKTGMEGALSSSHNIQQLVSGITNLASSASQSLGIDATVGAAATLNTILSSGTFKGLDPNLQAGLATRAAGVFERSDISWDQGGQFAFNKFSEQGLDINQAQAAQRVTPGEASALMLGLASSDAKKREEAEIAAKTTFAGGMLEGHLFQNGKLRSDASERIARIGRTNEGKGLINAGAIMRGNVSYDAANEYVDSGFQSKQFKKGVDETMYLNTGVAQASSALLGRGRKSSAPEAAGDLFTPNVNPLGVAATSANITTAPNQISMKEGLAGEKQLESRGFDMTTWVSTIDKFREAIDLFKEADAPRKAAESMATAAQDFGTQLKTFNSSIKQAADAMTKAAEVMGGKVQIPSSAVSSSGARDMVGNINGTLPGAAKRGGY